MSDIGELRSAWTQEKKRLEQAFLATRNAAATLEGYTAEIDKIVYLLASKYLPDNDVSVIATGGYGRKELYPCSDVDLLLIHGTRSSSQFRDEISSFLKDLWDVGLRVGQQVLSWDEVSRIEPGENELVFSLMDGRFLAGEEERARQFQDWFRKSFLRTHREELIERLARWIEERHLTFQNTIYQLEPDLKDAPGGLRDYHTSRWLIALGCPGREFVPHSDEDIESAHWFLAGLRVTLHLLNRRDRNVLTHRLQEQAARQLGYGRLSKRSAVESLMKDYFLKARILHRLTIQMLRGARPLETPDGVTTIEAGPLHDLEDVLRIYQQSIDEGRELSDRLNLSIQERLPEIAATLSYPQVAPAFLEVLQPRTGLYRGLSQMYESGILETLLPEFGTIKACVIRDFYHKYTVDEHTLQAVRAVENLLLPGGDFRFRALLNELGRPEILTLSLLLHDVGKGRGGKHVETGARLAGKALKRFRFDKNLVDTVVFLIRHHLAMSATLFRRNPEDPDVVRLFCDLVGSTERLKLLCLLTYADIRAVAPGTMNAWKQDRLWQLYVAAYNRLTLGYGDKRIREEDIGEILRSGLPRGLNEEEFETFLEGFPLRYLKTTPAAEIYEHFRMGRNFRPGGAAQFRLVDRKSHYELCVVTSDTRHLFSRIVGLLSYFNMNILRGYGFSNRQGIVLDFFQFADPGQVFRLNPQETERFQQLLEQVVPDELPIDKLLLGKESSIVFQPKGTGFEPRVSFDESYSDDCTIMEIVAPDSIGLLYRISKEISLVDYNIELVLISTEGDQAVDVFYLTHNSVKLSADERDRLRDRLLDKLG